MSSWAKSIRQCGGMHVAGVAKAKLGCSLGRVPNFVVQDELTSAHQSSTAEARRQAPLRQELPVAILPAVCFLQRGRWGDLQWVKGEHAVPQVWCWNSFIW